MTDTEDQRERVRALFDTVAPGYDHEALRYFPFVGDYLAHRLQPAPDWRVLDVACGTGAVSVALGQLLYRGGRVQAIDQSERMLDRAEANIAKMALDNVDLHVMDAQQTDFKSNYFHGLVCSFGLFFLPDMDAALREWLRVLQPGGRLLFSCFDAPAFQPMADMLVARLQAEGVELSESPAWKQLADREHACARLEAAGAVAVAGHTRQFGYHLNDAQGWWDVIWNSGYRGFLDQLDQRQLGRLRREHLEEVQALATDKGIWMDVSVHIIEGRKPATGETG